MKNPKSLIIFIYTCLGCGSTYYFEDKKNSCPACKGELHKHD